MAVQGTFYRAETQRRGVTPVSPPNAEDDPIDPVNPPGSGTTTTYKQLGDTTDKSFIGKNGYVPVVVGENQLTLQPLPNGQQDGLISGGIVQWTGTGYVFNVSSALARREGLPLSSSPDLLTLTTADPTNPRIDLFILQILFDGNGIPTGMEADFITGTPAATPVKPQIDPATQIELTQVSVPALSTSPTLTEDIIYTENVEWTGSSSGTGTVNFASTTAPFAGTVSIETTNIQNNQRVILTDSADVDLADYLTLGFQVRLKAALSASQNIGISFRNSSGTQVTNELIMNLDKSISGAYQFVGIALSSFTFSSPTKDVRSIVFRFIRSSGSTTFSGYFLDVIKLEGGINPPVQFGTFLTLQDTPTSYSGQAGKVVAVKSDESGLEFITGGGGGITGSGNTNEIAYFTGATAIASLSTATYPSLTELSYVKGVTSSIQTQLNGKPTTFLGLTDTPSSYTSQANKWVRVNGTPDALVFDTVSPYDLDQEGATDGQVLAWSTANSRYQPSTVSSGGSNWTVVGSDIYRNSNVAIGRTTIPSNGTGLYTFSVRSKVTGASGDDEYFLLESSAAVSHFIAHENGLVQINPTGIVAATTIGNISSFSGSRGLVIRPSGAGQSIITTNTLGTVGEFGVTDTGIIYTRNSIQAGVNIGTIINGWGSGFRGLGNNNASRMSLIVQRSTGTVDFQVASNGEISVFDGGAMLFGTVTGFKLGTATTQKLAFWNKTPIVQPTTAIAAAAFVANTSGIADNTATFGGYTIGQVVQALQNVGILA